jgi:hypothetical protein
MGERGSTSIGGRVSGLGLLGGGLWRNYTPLHYTTLHCTTSQYTSIHYTTLHYITIHYTTSHKSTTLHITLHHIFTVTVTACAVDIIKRNRSK